MPVRRPLRVCAAVLLLSSLVLAQSRPPIAPLPSDPLELATGPTKVLDSPQLRALVLGLLEQARQNNGMHTPGGAAFDIKLSFNSLGQSRYTGSGELEEVWMNGQTWRWEAKIADYSISHLFYRGAVYDEKPKGSIPLRLQMVRSAVFWPVVGNFAPAYLRVATAKWDGDEVMCVLSSRGADSGNGETDSSEARTGRRWNETEYCIDPQTGRLRTYSEAPGIYTIYDYNDVTIHFHGRTLARQISVVAGGTIILQIHIDSIADPHVTDPGYFLPTHYMRDNGPQGMMAGPFRFPHIAPAPPGSAAVVQPVVVVATLDRKGKVMEAEAMPGQDASLSTAAVSLVTQTTYFPAARGAAQRLAYINVKFVPRAN